VQPLKYHKKATIIKRKLTRKLTLNKKAAEDDTLLRVQDVFTKTNYSCFKALNQLKDLDKSAKLFMDELVQD